MRVVHVKEKRLITRRQADLVVLADGMTPDQLKWLYIDAILIIEGDNTLKASRRLGIHRRTLQRVIAAQREKKE